MDEESLVDPRNRPLEPTPAEVDAWAEREHARRQAWLCGPTEVEKHDWARRARRKAALGLGESALAPAPEEVEAWALRERRRRQAWVDGPSDAEKREWAASRGREAGAGAAIEPADPDAIEQWAGRERARRQEWLAGPTAGERVEWARRQSEGLLASHLHLPAGLAAERELVATLLREAEVAGRGTLSALARASGALWSYVARARESAEPESSGPPRRSRVPY